MLGTRRGIVMPFSASTEAQVVFLMSRRAEFSIQYYSEHRARCTIEEEFDLKGEGCFYYSRNVCTLAQCGRGKRLKNSVKI